MNKNRIIGISIVVLIMGILLVVVNLYIDYNLRKYSVYYAHNMEHKEGTHPELAMALENMDVIYKPDKKNIRYREDGGYTINKNFLDSEQFSINYNRGEKELFYGYYDITYKSYYFNGTFKLTRAYDSSVGHDEIDIKTVNQEALYKKSIKTSASLSKPTSIANL